MPTICHEFDERFRGVDGARRGDRGRRVQRDTRGGGPLGIFMIKTVPTIMVGVGAEVNGSLRESWRSDAPPENAEGGNTHDRGTVRKETAAFPHDPYKRHVYTHPCRDDSTEVLVAEGAFFIATMCRKGTRFPAPVVGYRPASRFQRPTLRDWNC
jgi:hypothetical protein